MEFGRDERRYGRRKLCYRAHDLSVAIYPPCLIHPQKTASIRVFRKRPDTSVRCEALSVFPDGLALLQVGVEALVGVFGLHQFSQIEFLS